METSTHWLPLTEYALRNGLSISTLRRKIKSNSIEYKMEDGRYLIKSEGRAAAPASSFVSSDASPSARILPSSRPISAAEPLDADLAPVETKIENRVGELEALREEMRQMQDDNLLRWKALEARVSGLAKKLEFFSEQIAEARMLVKIFEEKLDQRA